MALSRDVPESRSARWELVRELVNLWYRPITARDGTPISALDEAEERLGVNLPAGLKEWYLLAGERGDVWSAQDKFLPPSGLVTADDFLIFYVENQGVVEWGLRRVHLSRDDPPVHLLADEQVLDNENDTVSQFAVQMLLYSLKFSRNHRAGGSASHNPDALEIVRKRFTLLGLPNWHWPAYPTRFYFRSDVIVEVQGLAEKNCWIDITSRSQASLDETTALLASTGMRCERFSDL